LQVDEKNKSELSEHNSLNHHPNKKERGEKNTKLEMKMITKTKTLISFHHNLDSRILQDHKML
jgi:hypothetical protein